jgi:hypothetical protein
MYWDSQHAKDQSINPEIFIEVGLTCLLEFLFCRGIEDEQFVSSFKHVVVNFGPFLNVQIPTMPKLP